MTTQIIPLENGEIILLPDWQLSHIGITRDETGKRKGHTDFENATGSVFAKEFLGPLNNEQDELRAINKLTDSLIDVLTAPNTLRSGNLIQAELPRLVGYDALTKSDACNGVIIKSEYDPSLNKSGRTGSRYCFNKRKYSPNDFGHIIHNRKVYNGCTVSAG